MHRGTLCSSYLTCPSTGAGGQTCLCLCLQGRSLLGLCQHRSKQGSGCRAGPRRGIPSSCCVTSESRAVSRGGWVGWHHGAGTVQPGLTRHRRQRPCGWRRGDRGLPGHMLALGCSRDGHWHGHRHRQGKGGSPDPPAPARTGTHSPHAARSICPGRRVPSSTTEGKGHKLLCPLENRAGQEPSGVRPPGI